MKLKLLMAVSSDGFVARSADDDMRWTGPADKFLFKLLTTSSGNGVLLAGRTTAEQMPALPYRQLVALSRNGCGALTLEQASHFYGEAWLIGGPTVALAALQAGLVNRAYISRVPAVLGGGLPFGPIQELLPPEKIFMSGEHVSGAHLTAYFHLNQKAGNGT